VIGPVVAPPTGMLVGIALFLLIGWLVLKLAVGVTSFAVHALLALAVLAVILHFVRGARSTSTTS
jgi:hypothetical protein